MASQKKTASQPAQDAPDFSIDEFIGEIEKAEAERLNKRLPQERLRNKRALDNAARRAAESADAAAAAEFEAAQPKKPKKATRSAATGMSLKAPKSKANAVDRPTNLPGFEEPAAGFGHVPSGRVTARDISRAAAKDPAAMEQLRGALATTRSNIGETIVPAGRAGALSRGFERAAHLLHHRRVLGGGAGNVAGADAATGG